MINKKNLLGKTPHELGDKDAIHVAIVSVRAAESISPGQHCKMNEYNEAIPDVKGIGVADPFRKSLILTGESFWLLLNQDAVPNVRHVWEHPDVKFDPPTREIEYNEYIVTHANEYKVSYQQLMAAADSVVNKEKSVPYPGTLTKEELEELQDNFESYDFWSEWKCIVDYEFENMGSTCCPEYEYPNIPLFYWR